MSVRQLKVCRKKVKDLEADLKAKELELCGNKVIIEGLKNSLIEAQNADREKQRKIDEICDIVNAGLEEMYGLSPSGENFLESAPPPSPPLEPKEELQVAGGEEMISDGGGEDKHSKSQKRKQSDSERIATPENGGAKAPPRTKRASKKTKL